LLAWSHPAAYCHRPPPPPYTTATALRHGGGTAGHGGSLCRGARAAQAAHPAADCNRFRVAAHGRYESAGSRRKLCSRWQFPIRLAFSVADARHKPKLAEPTKTHEITLETLALIDALDSSLSSDECVKTVVGLLDKGANANANPPRDRRRPLYLAAKGGYVEAIKILLDANADVNGRAVKGETPLHGAVRGKSRDCVGCLLDAGAKLDLQDIAGRTAAGLADELGDKTIKGMIAAKIAAPNLMRLTKPKH